MKVFRRNCGWKVQSYVDWTFNWNDWFILLKKEIKLNWGSRKASLLPKCSLIAKRFKLKRYKIEW
jgi:hypothetical protein